MSSQRCAITGTGGFIGSSLAAFYRKRGWQVVEMSRKAKETEGNIPYTLGTPVDPKYLAGIDTLIHCAYDFDSRSKEAIWRTNVEGTRQLFEAARTAGVPLRIFISSVSCYDGCQSLYGLAKLANEKDAERLGLTLVRPGLVYGKNSGGIVGDMQKRATEKPVVPMIGSGDTVQCFTHIDDLCELLYLFSTRQAQIPPYAQPITAASEKLLTFREMIEELATAKNKKPLLVPVPWQFAYFVLQLAEKAGLNTGKLRSDSVIGAVKYNRNLDFSATRKLPVHFRVFQSGEL